MLPDRSGLTQRETPSAHLYLDRARAESFGSVAEGYDRYRLSYPERLIDDLAALHPQQTLDVGCGTGKAAVALLRRGLSVLGVEPDERMAAVARNHGLTVEVSTLEAWEDAGRGFDLITFADSWHWLIPTQAVSRVKKILRPNGTVARFSSAFVLDQTAIAAFDTVYRLHAPDVAQVWRPTSHDTEWPAATTDVFSTDDGFGETAIWTYEEQRILSAEAEEWVGLMSTVSDHVRLGPLRLAALLEALRHAIDDLGGVISSHVQTRALINQRNVGGEEVSTGRSPSPY